MESVDVGVSGLLLEPQNIQYITSNMSEVIRTFKHPVMKGSLQDSLPLSLCLIHFLTLQSLRLLDGSAHTLIKSRTGVQVLLKSKVRWGL